jgi:putative transport protein
VGRRREEGGARVRGRARRAERRRRRLTGYRAGGLRAYTLENRTPRARPSRVPQGHPQYRIVNVVRGDETLGAGADIMLQLGDVVALGGKLEDLTANIGLIGAEVAEPRCSNIPLDQAEILVTEKSSTASRSRTSARRTSPASCRSRDRARGEPIPVGTDTELKRFDVLYVTGLKGAVNSVAASSARSRARAPRPTC